MTASKNSYYKVLTSRLFNFYWSALGCFPCIIQTAQFMREKWANLGKRKGKMKSVSPVFCHPKIITMNTCLYISRPLFVDFLKERWNHTLLCNSLSFNSIFEHPFHILFNYMYITHSRGLALPWPVRRTFSSSVGIFYSDWCFCREHSLKNPVLPSGSTLFCRLCKAIQKSCFL
jgi:hypothetical protein